MWLAIRVLRLYAKNFTRIATVLEELRDLYQLDLASRGVIRTDPTMRDPVEVEYGTVYSEGEELV